MKIDRVIVSTTSHKNYINFWPIVSKSWKNLGITPTLIYTSSKKIKFNSEQEVLNINIDGIEQKFQLLRQMRSFLALQRFHLIGT